MLIGRIGLGYGHNFLWFIFGCRCKRPALGHTPAGRASTCGIDTHYFKFMGI